MWYRVQITKDGKIKQYRDIVYIKDCYGEEMAVSKDWVKKNVSTFTNLGISNNQLYITKDKFEKAIILVESYIYRQVNSAEGLNTVEERKLIETVAKQPRSKKANLTMKSNKIEIWNYISYFNLDNWNIFLSCLYRVIKAEGEEGKRCWEVETPTETFIFTNCKYAVDKAKQTGGNLK